MPVQQTVLSNVKFGIFDRSLREKPNPTIIIYEKIIKKSTNKSLKYRDNSSQKQTL